MLTYGFYNSVNRDRRYDAEQIGAMFDGLITDGVFANYKSALRVTAGSGRRELIINPGKAWFNGTWTTVDDGCHHIYLVGSAVETTYFIYLTVNKADRVNTIAGYTYERISDPGKNIYSYLLAQVTIPGGVDDIQQSMIVDTRGSDLCPYVTGILETVSFEAIVREVCGDNWQAWLDEYSDAINLTVSEASEIANTALAIAKRTASEVNESNDNVYTWAQYSTIPTGASSYSFEQALDVQTQDAPPQRKLFWAPSFDGNTVTLINPLQKTPLSAKMQLENWTRYKYFYGDGVDGTTDSTVYRYDELSVVYDGNIANPVAVYRIKTSKAVVDPSPVVAGDFIGFVVADSPFAYPKNGPSGEHWYIRYSARAEDIFFDDSELPVSARTVQEAIEVLYKNGVTGDGNTATKPHIEVDSLPEIGVSGVIYILKNPNGGDSDEYIWVNRWEKLGGSRVSGSYLSLPVGEDGTPVYGTPGQHAVSDGNGGVQWVTGTNGNVLGYYSATEYGAKGDGVTDDSPALNALVKTVHDAGGGTIWLPKGIYMLDSPIIWMSNVSLRGEGMGISVLKPRQAAGVGEGFAAIRGRKVTHFTADAPCENATFEQFSIDGSEMNITQYTSWPKGINIHYMRDCVFRDFVIRDTKATGLGIDMLENVTIDGIFLYNCGAGAYVDNAEINEGGAGIGIGTWGMPQESFIIRNCVADGCGRYGIFLERQGGTSDDTVANYTIANNIVKNGRKHGIVVKGGSRVNVTGNTCYNNAQYGMAVLENNGFLTDVVKFSGNLSYNNGVGFAVDTEEAAAEDIFCEENVISGCDTGVLILSSVDGLAVARNTIKRCTEPVVIEGGSQHNLVYKDNILLDNGGQPRTTATFTGCTDYIDKLETGHPTRVEIPAADLILGIKIMPDGSETADSVAQSTGFVDVQGMGNSILITTTAETWDSKDSARVAQYDADKVCLQSSAPTYSVSDNNPNELTVELLSGCAYVRIFYGAGRDKTVPAALTSVVIEAASSS